MIMLADAPARTQATQGTGTKVNQQGATVKAFLDRVNAYLALQEKAADGLPGLKPTDNPSSVTAFQRALAARIRLARPAARPGDVFGDAAPMFRDVIRRDAQTRTARDRAATMEEVPARDPLRVNADYPEKAALATVPPLILTNLPRLPDGLEYRFMGRDLILRDMEANLIVDFVNEAAAPIRR